MIWTVPTAIEDALYAAARRQLPAEVIGGHGLTAAVIDRSKRYTSEREHLATSFAEGGAAADLAARALFFTVADAAKIMIPLAELAGRGLLPRGTPVRIVDVGAGAGAMTLGALAMLAGQGVTHVEIRALDRDAGALAILAEAVPAAAKALGISARVSTGRVEVIGAELPPADLVLAGTVLNELPADRRLELVKRMIAATKATGATILIEPALRDTARDLHVLRDQILERGLAHVFAPCTRTVAPCPALADERDWCHEDRPARLPPRAAKIAQVTRLRDAGLKLAYLTLRRDPAPLVETGPDVPAWRIVSHHQRTKGKLEVHGCGDAGRIKLRLLTRDRSADNRAFDRADRGDVVLIDRPPTIDDPDLGGAKVTRIAPAELGMARDAGDGADDGGDDAADDD